MSRSALPRAARVLLVVLILLTPVCALLFIFLRSNDARTDTLTPVLMPFPASRLLAPMGDNILVSADAFIYAYKKTGEKAWEYPLDNPSVEVYATNGAAAVWSEQNMRILGADGTLVFTGGLSDGIRAVRCGEALFAALTADDVIYVFDTEGRTIDTILQEGAHVLDFGFYNQGDLMWVLSLETSGAVPVSHVSTYQPSRVTLGGSRFSDQIVYRALFYKNEVALVGSHRLMLNSDNGAPDKYTDVLIYGNELLDARVARDKLSLLFAPAAQIQEGRISAVKLYYGLDKKDWLDFTLPPDCFTAVIGERAIYAVARNAITAMPYSGVSRTHAMPEPIDDVLAVLDGGSMVIRSGLEAYVVTMP